MWEITFELESPTPPRFVPPRTCVEHWTEAEDERLARTPSASHSTTSPRHGEWHRLTSPICDGDHCCKQGPVSRRPALRMGSPACCGGRKWRTAALMADERGAPKYHAWSRPSVVEREETHRAIALAERALRSSVLPAFAGRAGRGLVRP